MRSYDIVGLIFIVLVALTTPCSADTILSLNIILLPSSAHKFIIPWSSYIALDSPFAVFPVNTISLSFDTKFNSATPFTTPESL